MDPRVIVHDGKLIAGSVRAVGSNQANVTRSAMGQRRDLRLRDRERARPTRSSCIRISSRTTTTHRRCFVRNDGRYLAVYSKHAKERRMYSRLSEPHNPLVWGPASAWETPGDDAAVAGNNATYANLFRMPNGRIFNFIRAFHHDPNYMVSDDDGSTWTYGGRWLYGKGGYSPYLKFADDGKGTVHFVATEDHPRNFDNSLFHGYLRDGTLHHSNGTTSRRAEHLDRSNDRHVGLHQGLSGRSGSRRLDGRHRAGPRRATVCPLLDAARRARPSSGPGRHGSAVPLRADGTGPRGGTRR